MLWILKNFVGVIKPQLNYTAGTQKVFYAAKRKVLNVQKSSTCRIQTPQNYSYKAEVVQVSFQHQSLM